MNTYRNRIFRASLALFTFVSLSFLSTNTVAQSMSLPLQLTPRPTTEPETPTPPTEVPENITQPDLEGALIWLRVKSEADQQPTEIEWQMLWTVVQWQDAAGNWHDVEGWQGGLDDWTKEGRKVWWLPESLFGKGPFRWVVYERQNGELSAESAPFYLPQYKRETVTIYIKVKL